MKILYVFPHPDDESFGPAPTMVEQIEKGHEVSLLTLTRGEATSQRHRYGYSLEEMGDVRSRELRRAAQVIGVHDLTILDFPDSQLKELNPLRLEEAVADHIEEVRPEILITYPVHGISGFHDHLVTHAVLKRVFCMFRSEDSTELRRLAFFTVHDPIQPSILSIQLESSPEAEIDCVVSVSQEAVARAREALLCYETYQQVIEESRILEQVAQDAHFEIFQEDFTPPIDDITKKL